MPDIPSDDDGRFVIDITEHADHLFAHPDDRPRFLYDPVHHFVAWPDDLPDGADHHAVVEPYNDVGWWHAHNDY